MIKGIRIHPDAQLELDDAMEYLDGQREGLSDMLESHVDAALDQIIDWPNFYPFIYKEFRKFRVDPFKYAIVYRVSQDNVINIAAFWHLMQDEATLRRKLDQRRM